MTSIANSAFSGCYFTASNFVNNSSLSPAENDYWGATIVDEEHDNGLLIKDNAVVRCRSWVTSVTIPEYVTSIGGSAFADCSSLQSVTIPTSVTSIGGSAFADCSSLQSVTIPTSVTRIGNYAFADCSSLNSITIFATTPFAIYYYTFENCNATLHVLPGCGDAYRAARYWQNFNIVEDARLTPEEEPKEATFDFTDPIHLYPAIEPEPYDEDEENPGQVDIATKTLSDNDLELTLDKGTRTQTFGSRIITTESNKHYLTIYTNATMSFTVPAGGTIKSIVFTGTNGVVISYFNVSTGSLENGSWTGSAESVTFTATANSNIDKVSVEYLFEGPIVLADGETFENDEVQEDVTIKYNRTFNDTKWQPLFVPFALAYDDWSENFEIARLNAFYEYDEQGESKKKIEFIVIKDDDAVLRPNHPYLIRAKEEGEKTFELTNAKLYMSDVNTFDNLSCSTVETSFEIKGTYRNDESILGKYYVANGKFWLDQTGYTSVPYRWFISSESKGGQYDHSSQPARANSIDISVIGSEEEDVTMIENVNSTSVTEGVKYTLDGRRIYGEPRKNTLYIMNGRKYIK